MTLPKQLLFSMLIIYTLQSAIGALMYQGIPAVLREQGIRLDQLGLMSLLFLPWVFKFFWSGPVERWRLKTGKEQRSLQLILTGIWLSAILLAALSFVDPSKDFSLILVCLLVTAFIVATVDIAADGYMIERLSEDHRGWGNMIQIGSGYLGILLGSSAFLIISGSYGWAVGILMLSVSTLVFSILLRFSAKKVPKHQADVSSTPSVVSAFKTPVILYGLLFVVVCQLGLRMVLGLATPFIIDQGFTPQELGMLTGLIGIPVNLLVVFLTAVAIRYWKALKVLFVILAIEVLVFSLFAFSVNADLSKMAVGVLFVANSSIAAAGFVALYTQMTHWVSLKQPGIDFSIFQSMDMMVAVVTGMLGGIAAQHFGYFACFVFAVISILISAFVLPKTTRIINRYEHAAN